jgi:hypothetical protein
VGFEKWQLGKSAGKANAINPPQGVMKSQGMMAIWKMVGWRHSKITSNCGDLQNTHFWRLTIRSATPTGNSNYHLVI